MPLQQLAYATEPCKRKQSPHTIYRSQGRNFKHTHVTFRPMALLQTTSHVGVIKISALGAISGVLTLFSLICFCFCPAPGVQFFGCAFLFSTLLYATEPQTACQQLLFDTNVIIAICDCMENFLAFSGLYTHPLDMETLYYCFVVLWSLKLTL